MLLYSTWPTRLFVVVVGLAESPAMNESVFEHAPGSRGAKDYDVLLDELMAGGFIK